MTDLQSVGSRWRWMAGTAFVAASIALVLTLVQSPGVAQAKGSYLNSLINTYPALSGTKLDSCRACHTNVPALNAFGQAYQNSGYNFSALEQLDSDGDGWTNIDEIQAVTLPGSSGDHPVAAATTTTHLPAVPIQPAVASAPTVSSQSVAPSTNQPDPQMGSPRGTKNTGATSDDDEDQDDDDAQPHKRQEKYGEKHGSRHGFGYEED